MAVKLDQWDRKILYELDIDASISLKDLSRKIGRSKGFLSYRIKRLESEKVINGYTAIVDMSKLGYFTFRVYIRFQNTDLSRMKEIVEYLKGKKQVWTIAQLHGKWDYAFFVGAKKIDNFHKIWKGFLRTFKDNVKENKIAIYSPIFNFNKRFFIPSAVKAVERAIGIGSEEKVDGLDLDVINSWGVNVRQSASEIAQKLNTSPRTISSRIKSMMEKGIIVGCKIDLDQGRLGYQGYRVDLFLNSMTEREKLFGYCKNHHKIYQINDSIGGADFEFEIIVENLDDLLDIMNKMMEDFPGMIRNYEYFSFLLFPKLTIVPD